MEENNLNKILKDAFPPIHEPPYDSPIEDIFAYHLVKYIRPDAKLDKQVTVETPKGIFRLDFVVSVNGRQIGIECDGEKFHDPWRDEWRDALILGAGFVNDIVRISGKTICGRVHICLLRLSTLYPQMFSDRGKKNIETLATNEAREIFEAHVQPPMDDEDFDIEGKIEIIKESVQIESRIKSKYFLEKLFTFAISSQAKTLDQIIEEYSTNNLNEERW